MAVLVVVDRNHDTVERIDIDSGDRLWFQSHGLDSLSYPHVPLGGDAVYVGGLNGGLQRRDPSDGSLVFDVASLNDIRHVRSAPDHSWVYVSGGASSTDRRVQQHNPTDGAEGWNANLTGTRGQGLAVGPTGEIFSGSESDRISRVDPDGSVAWDTNHPSATPNYIAVDPETLNAWASFDSELQEYDRADGTALRQIVVSSGNNNANGVVVDPDGAQVIVAISADNLVRGYDLTADPIVQLWEAAVTDPITVHLTPDGTRLFVVAKDGVYEVDRDAQTATLLRAPASGGEFWRGAMDGDGTWPDNVPPDAPILTNPVNGASIDRTSTERFTWDFSDPDDGDSQSKFDLQIREQGATLLDVDVTQETVNEYYDLAGGTLAAGDYEWRVRTYDAQGEQGPWSSWEPFVAADPPDGPTITDPASGGTISTETYTVEWSASEQDAYQLRRVADDAGSPDTTTVYFDTGTVESGSARSRSVEFPVNNRHEHIQVRVRRDGLWSVWASNRVEVSYTPPADPSVTVSVYQDAALDADITNPTPGTGEPSVSSNEVHRRKVADTGDGIRVAVGVSPSGLHRDWAVASDTGYEYRVRAIGDNGTSSWSAWTA